MPILFDKFLCDECHGALDLWGRCTECGVIDEDAAKEVEEDKTTEQIGNAVPLETAKKAKHIINLSGGACSFWAAERVAQKYGTQDLVLLFADVLIEDKDLYELNEWTAEYFGVPITRISRELTPWQLFRQEGLIANNRLPICSVKLKREPLDEWHLAHCTPKNSLFGEPDTIYVGLDWTEINRLTDLRNALPQWQIEAPMAEWQPLWDKCKMLTELQILTGRPLPKAYIDGFPHNNCGRRCVRAGITHWVHLYKTDPDQFLEWEVEEKVTQKEFAERGISNSHFTVLRDRRGGSVLPMTFAQLRERILAGDPTLPKNDWGGCGCGVEIEVRTI